MNIVFRVDASSTIGSGHVSRCLCLAHALTAAYTPIQNTQLSEDNPVVQCQFICQDLPGNMATVIANEGFTTNLLPHFAEHTESLDAQASLAVINQPIDLLIIDHYQLSKTYSSALRSRCRHIIVIDDLANRVHDCDILIDCNLLPKFTQRYQHLVKPSCLQLLGPEFALLRPEFYQAHRQQTRSNILVFLGGGDSQNVTYTVLEALFSLQVTLPKQTQIDVVLGAANPWIDSLQKEFGHYQQINWHIQCDYMASLMANAFLAIGAGGSTHWERCVMQLPALVVTVADNQIATTQYLATLGACAWLGTSEKLTSQHIATELNKLLQSPELLASMRQEAAKIIPKNAGITSIVREIKNLIGTQLHA
ncbi:UDP-2,4-diacetamido-2,4,6-trideoxy-beta-L-altropyranose hydrolase [Shewanella aestuarii]|uniref:UDP-2,4-diacetamido-2,4, 6-trideoxy-beta-L-altropyranose hydrolase n=1 Tax=Shewanella aestuarii TaxID=1028752 RepID=A0A6G9QIR6_9GAMM|nr:UDP-2,4-diacetamido-2,4,6-trideoxy-beta-L-altropyranose hydrolase [Shewanella aestuarii]QIR13955.1 UDP-2,4-diacetamido-2,4,6-trideoxy-beta-L-altropyranose hydrolase [Shewanella aestuarii]